MIARLDTYSIGDFIPFTEEIYFRLFERINAAQWPLHILTVLMGVGAVALLRRGHGRTGAALLAIPLFWISVSFYFRYYAELTPVAVYSGWGTILLAPAILVGGMAGKLDAPRGSNRSFPVWLGYALFVFGLLCYPLIAPLAGRGWKASEVFGISPDPTLIATLGVLLIAARGPWLPILAIIPLLGCILSGATLWGLGSPLALIFPGVILVAIAGIGGACWQGIEQPLMETDGH